jgi:hypothetical protein
MSQIRSPSLARCYGMVRVARVWKISRASVYRSLKETPPNTIGRPGPVGACSDAELAEHIPGSQTTQTTIASPVSGCENPRKDGERT